MWLTFLKLVELPKGLKVMRLDDEAQIVTFALVDPVIEDEEVDAPELTDETISTDNNEE